VSVAAEVYRVERVSGTEPLRKQHLGARAVGTALTGIPMPSSKPRFDATLRVLDEAGSVVLEKYGESRTIDALELEILHDLMQMDVETFRTAYGLPEEAPE
jgi:hypothetical protein